MLDLFIADITRIASQVAPWERDPDRGSWSPTPSTALRAGSSDKNKNVVPRGPPGGAPGFGDGCGKRVHVSRNSTRRVRLLLTSGVPCGRQFGCLVRLVRAGLKTLHGESVSLLGAMVSCCSWLFARAALKPANCGSAAFHAATVRL